MKPLVMATRGSKLALRQSAIVRDAIRSTNPGLEVKIKKVRTAGDALVERIDEANPDKKLDKGMFTSAVEDELLAGRCDIAVHSLKDLPVDIPAGLVLAAIPPRADPADVLISKSGKRLDDLPAGAIVLAGSARRTAQILHRRGDLDVRPVRGNVPTRVKRLREGDADAMVLAAAGLIRLAMEGEIAERLDPVGFLPACGQGALAIEARTSDARTCDLLRPLDHAETRLAVSAERAFLARLGAGCHAAAGAMARETDDAMLTITGMVADADGARLVKHTIRGTLDGVESAEAMGCALAEALLAQGARAILDEAGISTKDGPGL